MTIYAEKVVFAGKIVYTDYGYHTTVFDSGKGREPSFFMYGAILGDIAGSRFEFSKPAGFHPRKVDLFANSCFYTDDTVMTIATKYAIKKGIPYAKAYGLFGRKYPKVGYGTMFKQWLDSCSEKGYNSFGNGAAMRVSYIGRHFRTLEEVEKEAGKSAACTHNHPEGIKGAVAAAGCTFLAYTGCSKKEIRDYASDTFGYDLRKPLFLRRPFSKFDITCQGSLPLALVCFLESHDWESCIRNVFSIKCDTDTIGCIAGGIAEAYYGKTGFDNDALLRRYLIKPNDYGRLDTFLYDWAKMPD